MPHRKIASPPRRTPRAVDQPRRPQRTIFEIWPAREYRPETSDQRWAGRACIALAVLTAIYFIMRLAGWPA